MKYLTLLFVLAISFSNSAVGKEYLVDHSTSKITFSGSYVNNPFNGVFEKWEANINFNADNLSTSSVSATIDTSSAITGDPMIDGALPGKEWFDSTTYPKAHFKSKSIVKNTDGSYTAKGELTIRNRTVPVDFKFSLTPPDLASSTVKTNFNFTLDRLLFDMGKSADPKGEYVGLKIKVAVTLSAAEK